MKEAKPCPFCGHRPQVIRETELNFITGPYDHFYIRCTWFKCHVKPSARAVTLAQVMEFWNNRKRKYL